MSSTEFIIASVMTDPDKVGQYIIEGRKMGVPILAPDINKSDVDISVNDGEIYFGLADVKNAGKGAAQTVIRLRQEYGPIASHEHLLEIIEAENEEWEQTEGYRGRSPKQLCSKRAIDAWLAAGAFDFAGMDVSPQERAQAQKELLGVTLIDLFTDLYEKHKGVLDHRESLAVALENLTTPLVASYGIVSDLDIRRTRADAHPRYANKEFAMVTLEWQTESVGVVAFNKQWEDYGAALGIGAFVLVELKRTAKGWQLAYAESIE